MAYLNTRWARCGLEPDEACEAELSNAALMLVTGRGRPDVARKSVERLAILTGMMVDVSGEVCRIKWAKWAKFQELRPRECPEISPEMPPPQTPPPPHTHKRKKKSAADAAPRSRSPDETQKAKKTAFPEPFPQADRLDLQVWGEKTGFTLAQVDRAIQAVADWAVSNGKVKVSWVRTIQGAMREGWALGRRDGKPAAPEPNRPEYLEFDSPEWVKAHGYDPNEPVQ